MYNTIRNLEMLFKIDLILLSKTKYMRQNFLIVALFILVVNLFVSCKKDGGLESNSLDVSEYSKKSSISEWLISQKAGVDALQVKQLENLSQNLELGKIWNEPLTNNKYLSIVPLKKFYLNASKITDESTLYLVTVINKEKGI